MASFPSTDATGATRPDNRRLHWQPSSEPEEAHVATARELRQRWYERDGLRLTRAVRSWLMGQTSRPDGLSEIDGRVDLRGLPLSASPFTLGDQDDPGGGVTWEALDLRRAELDGLRFFGARLRNCLFDSANLGDLRLWGTEVVDCSFRQAKMPGASLGSNDWFGWQVVWRRVAFDLADLREASVWGAVLNECTFTKPNRLSLVDCEITGLRVRRRDQSPDHRRSGASALGITRCAFSRLQRLHIERLEHYRVSPSGCRTPGADRPDGRWALSGGPAPCSCMARWARQGTRGTPGPRDDRALPQGTWCRRHGLVF